jgi:hypothetical protein
MRWPRGKYNGRRIGGFEIRVRLNLFWWAWGLPDRYGRCLSLGPLHVWLSTDYDPER